jgi:hypothetical protein
VAEQTAEEAKKLHIAKMGEPLGEVYSARSGRRLRLSL